MPDVTQPIGPSGQAAQFAPIMDYANGQAVAFTGTSAQSSAVNSNSAIITANSDCYFTIGSNPTATTGAGSDFLPAGQKWGVTLLSGQKIAVIQSTAAGTLSIIPTKAF
jgi:hypothetical protein